MTLPRINTNIPAMRAHRSLLAVNEAGQKNMERLASGLRINRAADSPASLVVSERMRGQISSLNQAIENSEVSVSLAQTTEGALTEINRVLVNMRQLAVHASNVGVNDPQMMEADQAELRNSIEMIERVAKDTQFGTKALLDGSKGANGVATGNGLYFVAAGENTKSSPTQGYEVTISRAGSQATRTGTTALTQEMIDAGEVLTLTEGGRTVQMQTDKSMTVETVFNDLQRRATDAGLNLELSGDGNGILTVRHQDYGSGATFTVASSSAGVLSETGNVPFHVDNGRDVAGEINGEEALGEGQLLKGRDGNSNTAGITVRYAGELAPPGEVAGNVTVTQNSLIFQIGPNEEQTSMLSLRDMKPTSLANGISNESNYRSLADLNLTSFQGAQDAIRLIDKAIDETTSFRAGIGAFQTHTLESNLSYLRIAAENVTASESLIRDADFAKEMADFTRNQIVQQSAVSMLAQANNHPRSVLALLNA